MSDLRGVSNVKCQLFPPMEHFCDYLPIPPVGTLATGPLTWAMPPMAGGFTMPPQLLASSSFLSVVVVIVVLLLQTGILNRVHIWTTRNMHFSLLPSRRVQLSDLAPAYLSDFSFSYSLSLLHLSHAGLIFVSQTYQAQAF